VFYSDENSGIGRMEQFVLESAWMSGCENVCMHVGG